MSILDKEWKLSQQAQEFFVYTTMGIVSDDLFNKAVYLDYINDLLKEECKIACSDFSYEFYCAFMCAKSAYNDLCRTLTYASNYKSSSKDKEAIKEKEKIINRVCVELANAIYKDGSIESNPENLFKVLFIKDGCFQKCIVELSNLFEADNSFHFGQVQKWVNMTLKYLYLLGIVKEDNAKELHIPIDTFIMKALSFNGIKFPRRKENDDGESEYKEYSESCSVKWSRLNKSEYDKIVKDYSGKNLGKTPIEWEHEAWIKQSEKKKGVN